MSSTNFKITEFNTEAPDALPRCFHGARIALVDFDYGNGIVSAATSRGAPAVGRLRDVELISVPVPLDATNAQVLAFIDDALAGEVLDNALFPWSDLTPEEDEAALSALHAKHFPAFGALAFN
jgi:hypothetical protein